MKQVMAMSVKRIDRWRCRHCAGNPGGDASPGAEASEPSQGRAARSTMAGMRSSPSLPRILAVVVLVAPACWPWPGGSIGSARADTGVVVQAGLRAGSGFKAANGGDESLQLRSGAAGSLAFEWTYDDQRLWQVYASHQRTRLALGS